MMRQNPSNRQEQMFKEFKKFHENNPIVWKLFKQFTFEVLSRGRKHFSVNAIFERIRWYTDIETNTADDLKLSNNHRPYYARMFHAVFPNYHGFFCTKELVSGISPPNGYQGLGFKPTVSERELYAKLKELGGANEHNPV